MCKLDILSLCLIVTLECLEAVWGFQVYSGHRIPRLAVPVIYHD